MHPFSPASFARNVVDEARRDLFPNGPDPEAAIRQALQDAQTALKTDFQARLPAMVAELKAALHTGAGPQGGSLLSEQTTGFRAPLYQSIFLALADLIQPENPKHQTALVPLMATNASAGHQNFTSGVTCALIDEHDLTNDTNRDEPELQALRLVPRLLQASAYISRQAFNSHGVPAQLERLFLSIIAWWIDRHILLGPVVGGILNAPAAIAVTRSGASAIAAADVAGMLARFHHDPQDTTRCRWIMSNSAYAKFALLDPGLWGGIPVALHNGLPALSTVNDIALVNCNYVSIFMTQKPTFEHSEHPRFEQNQIVINASATLDAGLTIASPITPAAGSSVSPVVVLTTA